MEYYLATKRNEGPIHATINTNPENTINKGGSHKRLYIYDSICMKGTDETNLGRHVVIQFYHLPYTLFFSGHFYPLRSWLWTVQLYSFSCRALCSSSVSF